MSLLVLLTLALWENWVTASDDSDSLYTVLFLCLLMKSIRSALLNYALYEENELAWEEDNVRCWYSRKSHFRNEDSKIKENPHWGKINAKKGLSHLSVW